MHFVRNIVANDKPRHAVTYDWRYDDWTRPIDFVTCASGENGLTKRYGWKRLRDINTFPNIAGIDSITWNSTQCGTCWSIKYNGKTVYVLGVDNMGKGVNLPAQVFKWLVGPKAEELGSVDGMVVQLPVDLPTWKCWTPVDANSGWVGSS
jgi:hypothetical protein